MKTKKMKMIVGGEPGTLSGPADVIDAIRAGETTATVAYARGLVTFKRKPRVEPDPGGGSDA